MHPTRTGPPNSYKLGTVLLRSQRQRQWWVFIDGASGEAGREGQVAARFKDNVRRVSDLAGHAKFRIDF